MSFPAVAIQVFFGCAFKQIKLQALPVPVRISIARVLYTRKLPLFFVEYEVLLPSLNKQEITNKGETTHSIFMSLLPMKCSYIVHCNDKIITSTVSPTYICLILCAPPRAFIFIDTVFQLLHIHVILVKSFLKWTLQYSQDRWEIIPNWTNGTIVSKAFSHTRFGY